MQDDFNQQHTTYFEPLPSPTPNKKKRALLTALICFLVVIVLAFSVASLLKTYCTTTFIVDGDSMDPTLNGGLDSKAYVDTDTYEAARNDGDKVVLWTKGKLRRGDIVVFTPPSLTYALIKRVIGVAGDRVQIIANNVYVNGELLNENYILEPMLTADLDVTVPDGCIFAMGDNRNHSMDSRAENVGCVSTSTVRGKAIFLIPKGTNKLRLI